MKRKLSRSQLRTYVKINFQLNYGAKKCELHRAGYAEHEVNEAVRIIARIKARRQNPLLILSDKAYKLVRTITTINSPTPIDLKRYIDENPNWGKKCTMIRYMGPNPFFEIIEFAEENGILEPKLRNEGALATLFEDIPPSGTRARCNWIHELKENGATFEEISKKIGATEYNVMQICFKERELRWRNADLLPHLKGGGGTYEVLSQALNVLDPTLADLKQFAKKNPNWKEIFLNYPGCGNGTIADVEQLLLR